MTQPERTTYLTDRIGPLPFCSGCGHTVLLKALDQALVKLQPVPSQVVIVTDIGCIGLADRHFITSAFHGLHGRSITYACGLKLARPDLTVITLMGDGACGIGGTHLLNVARRNIGVKLIVANNFNYGMTGGQHSLTTPANGITPTTPWGNRESPMDICGTVAAAGGAWIHRATMFDQDLPELIVAAIEQPGFALLEVCELCTAYYAPRNKLGKQELLAMLDRSGFERGRRADQPRPEYSARYREMAATEQCAPPEKETLETQHPHALKKTTGIIIAGSAGQKIRSTASLFARGAMLAGLHATQKDDYPITVRTGHSVAEIILSPEPIAYTGIETPTYFVLMSEDGLRRTRSQIENLSPTCILYAEALLELPETPATVRRLPFKQAAKASSRSSVATAALAALLVDSGMFPAAAFAAALRRFQSPEIAAGKLKALAAGAALISGGASPAPAP